MISIFPKVQWAGYRFSFTGILSSRAEVGVSSVTVLERELPCPRPAPRMAAHYRPLVGLAPES